LSARDVHVPQREHTEGRGVPMHRTIRKEGSGAKCEPVLEGGGVTVKKVRR